MKNLLAVLSALASVTSMAFAQENRTNREVVATKDAPRPSGRIRRLSKRVGSSSHPDKSHLIPPQAN
jgi:hypothetical protein